MEQYIYREIKASEIKIGDEPWEGKWKIVTKETLPEWQKFPYDVFLCRFPVKDAEEAFKKYCDKEKIPLNGFGALNENLGNYILNNTK